jgi:hypothetical protein
VPAANAIRTRCGSHTGWRPPPPRSSSFRGGRPPGSGTPGPAATARATLIRHRGVVEKAAQPRRAPAHQHGTADWHQGSWCDWLVWSPPSLPGALLILYAARRYRSKAHEPSRRHLAQVQKQALTGPARLFGPAEAADATGNAQAPQIQQPAEAAPFRQGSPGLQASQRRLPG